MRNCERGGEILGGLREIDATQDVTNRFGTHLGEERTFAVLLDRLRAMACDEAQGYHISRPMPAEQFLGWHAGPGTAFGAAP